MATVATCLKDIDRVREVASGAEHAYVARSRLARLILRVTNLARVVIGASTDGVVSGEISDEVARILETCEKSDPCVPDLSRQPFQGSSPAAGSAAPSHPHHPTRWLGPR